MSGHVIKEIRFIIYRWHVVRKIAHRELDPELTGNVDVVIAPARDHFPTYRFEKAPRTLFELPEGCLLHWNPRLFSIHKGEPIPARDDVKLVTKCFRLSDKFLSNEPRIHKHAQILN